MPVVVPSRIVETLDRALPQLQAQQADSKVQVKLDRGRAGFLRGVLELVGQLPDHLLPTDADRYIELVAGKEAIRHQLDVVWLNNTDPLRELPGYGVSPLTLIRRALAECPDQTPTFADSDRFAFMGDQALEHSLALDVASAEAGLARSDFKVAIVMSGASIEALLLWAISKALSNNARRAIVAQQSQHFSPKAQSTTTDILEWALPDLIQLSSRAKLIDERATTLAGFAKDFRNLIHPGREQRTGIAGSRSNAATAVAALETVIEQVSKVK